MEHPVIVYYMFSPFFKVEKTRVFYWFTIHYLFFNIFKWTGLSRAGLGFFGSGFRAFWLGWAFSGFEFNGYGRVGF